MEDGERKLQVAFAGIAEVTHQLHQVANAEKVKKVAIISIMGQMRQGKSFMLNCMSRYFEWLENEMKEQGSSYKPRRRDPDFRFTDDDENADKTPEPWLKDLENETDKERRKIKQHFEILRGDDKACTEGIWCLSKPFVLINPNTKQKIAVLVMDSQGSFDPRKDPKVSTSILAVTAVLASSLICNTKAFDTSTVKNFDELNTLIENQVSAQTDDVGLSNSNCVESPFGSLVFLIRDKQFDFEEDDSQPMSFNECVSQVKTYTDSMLDPDKIDEQNAALRPVALRLNKNFHQVRSWGLVAPEKKVIRNASLDPRDFGTYFKRMLGEFFRSEFEDPSADFPRPSKHCLSGEELTIQNFRESITSVCNAFVDCDPRIGVPELAVGILAKKAVQNFKLHVRTDIKPCAHAKFPKEALVQAKQKEIDWFDSKLEERFAELRDRSESLLDREKLDNIIRQEEDAFNIDKLRSAEVMTRWGAGGLCTGVICGVTGAWKALWTIIIVPCPWTPPLAAAACTGGAYLNHARAQKNIKEWKIVKVIGDNVFGDMQYKDGIDLKKLDETVWGRQHGDWIELVDEPGRFMPIRSMETTFLEVSKEGLNPWDYRVCVSFAQVTWKKTYWYVQASWSSLHNLTNLGKTVLKTTGTK